MPLCMLGKPRIVIFLQQLYLQDPLMLPSTHKSFYQSTFPSQHKLAKKRTTMASSQPNPKPPHQKQKSRTTKKNITNLEDSSQNVKLRGPPDGAVGALCFSHNISPCHGLRLLQVPAGPYLSRGRGVGILPKGIWCKIFRV